jgi:hypothetical protein
MKFPSRKYENILSPNNSRVSHNNNINNNNLTNLTNDINIKNIDRSV